MGYLECSKNNFLFPQEMKLFSFSITSRTMERLLTCSRTKIDYRNIDNIEVTRRAKFSAKFSSKMYGNKTPSFEDIESFDINHNKEETMRYYVILLFDSMEEHPLSLIGLKLNEENRKL